MRGIAKVSNNANKNDEYQHYIKELYTSLKNSSSEEIEKEIHKLGKDIMVDLGIYFKSQLFIHQYSD